LTVQLEKHLQAVPNHPGHHFHLSVQMHTIQNFKSGKIPIYDKSTKGTNNLM
jgi:hypothetical protein